MKDTIMQITLREMKRSALSNKFWIGLLCISIILTVTGPFDTKAHFGAVQRFFYWGGIAVSTFFIAIFFNTSIAIFIERKTQKQLLARAISALVGGFFIGLWVYFINAFLIGIDENRLTIFLALIGNCILISFAVSALYFIVSDATGARQDIFQQSSPGSNTKPSFLKRLPKPLGTDLISLQAQDHYVEAITTKGRELVLIRLADAIAELGENDGLQTHRSWWVAKSHISDLKRIDGKLHLSLSNGEKVPVSRTFQAEVKHFLDSE